MSGRKKRLTLAMQKENACQYCGRSTGSAQKTCKNFPCRLKGIRDREPTPMNINAVYGKYASPFSVGYHDTDSVFVDNRETIDTVGETVQETRLLKPSGQ